MPGRRAGAGVARGAKAAEGPAPKKTGAMPKWKQQSLMFRQAMMAGKEPANDGYGGGGAASNFNPSMEMSQPEDDRV